MRIYANGANTSNSVNSANTCRCHILFYYIIKNSVLFNVNGANVYEPFEVFEVFALT